MVNTGLRVTKQTPCEAQGCTVRKRHFNGLPASPPSLQKSMSDAGDGGQGALNAPIFLWRNVKEAAGCLKEGANTAVTLQCLQAARHKGTLRKWPAAAYYDVAVEMEQKQRGRQRR